MDGEAYERHKRAAAARQAKISKEAREIGPLPDVVDPKRKEACRFNLRLFLETYAAETFSIAWSQDHLRVIEVVERVILEGGVFALAMPRGSGKTSIISWAAVWAIVYGHRRFVALVGATATHAKLMLESFKMIFEVAAKLGEDFPAACYPVRCLEGRNQRTPGQTLDGNRTRIRWKDDQLVFPTVPKAASSGSVVRVAGITGSIRGMQSRTAEGDVIRPDLALVDDAQTDESAWSLAETDKRERSLKGAVLGLSGPRKRIACFFPCTVIAPDDLAERLLDRQRSPDWLGERLKLLRSMPLRMDLWEQYRDIRAESLREKGDKSLATEFYRSQQAEMDKGADPSWPERYEPDQISAIQYAMDLWAKDEQSFFAEYQQDPKRPEMGGAGALRAHEVAARFSGYDRGKRPEWCQLITAGIDIQQDVLFYVVVGWDRASARGHVIDRGSWPEQNKPYFTLQDLRQTLQQRYKTATTTEALVQGLGELSATLLSRDYGGLSPEFVVCDGNWAPSTDTVYELSRTLGPKFLPYHGRYVGASSQALEAGKKEPGDREGPGWRITTSGKRRQRSIIADTNAWKSRVADWLRSKDPTRGLWFFGSSAQELQLIADHCAAEYPIAVEGRGRKLDEWKQRPGRDNHWWDCLVSAAVAGSILGVAAPGASVPVVKKRISYREQQQAKRVSR